MLAVHCMYVSMCADVFQTELIQIEKCLFLWQNKAAYWNVCISHDWMGGSLAFMNDNQVRSN